jgi:hypothetical protein
MKNIGHIPEDRIHEGLEDRGGIGQSEWHHHELKAAMPSSDTDLGDILLSYLDLAVPGPKVQGGEVGSTLEAVEDLIHPGDGVIILYLDLVWAL